MTTSDYPVRTSVLLDTVHEHDHEHDTNHDMDHNSYDRPMVSWKDELKKIVVKERRNPIKTKKLFFTHDIFRMKVIQQ